MTKYTVNMINFGYSHDQCFITVAEAISFGIERGFEFTVTDSDSNLHAAWSPIGGLNKYFGDNFN